MCFNNCLVCKKELVLTTGGSEHALKGNDYSDTKKSRVRSVHNDITVRCVYKC